MLGNYEQRIYINVTDGKFRQKCDPEHPKAQQRKVTNPKTGDSKIVTELVYGFYEGNIKKVYVREQEGYSKQWVVEMEDGEENVSITFGYDSGYAFAFLTRIFNLDLGQRVKLIPYYNEAERRTGIGMRQPPHAEDTVKPYYSKDNPLDMPRLENPDDEAERKIWKIKSIQFLAERVAAVISPLLNNLDPLADPVAEPVPAEDMKVKTTKEKEKESAIFADPDETGADDLPFA